MNTQAELRDKILKLAVEFMTAPDIAKTLNENNHRRRRVRDIIDKLVREGLMEEGPAVTLGNQQRSPTFRAVDKSLGDQAGAAVFFDGLAPSVFDWRGNFSLRP